jgi:predicted ATPase/DNA-binding winged helix-turn-helix (wHTH) protein
MEFRRLKLGPDPASPVKSFAVSLIQEHPEHTFRRGPYQVFRNLRLVLRHGEKVELTGKPFEILVALLEADNKLVSKDELLTRIWPDQFVEENNLQAHISAIRRALGPDRTHLKTEFGAGYRLELPSDVAAGEAVQSNLESKFELPIAPAALVGREDELAELDQMIAANNLVTISGLGGMGKTRLAIEFAQLKKQSATDVFFIELASLNAAALLPTISAQLHIDFESSLPSEGGNEKSQRLKKPLLILDSCEHLLEGAAQTVRKLQQAAPYLTILATSQEPLDVDGEQVLRLQPLRIPAQDTQTLQEASRYAAVELLVTRIKSADRLFNLSDANSSDICHICRQLDGIPLAIELAASRVPLLGLKAVVEGLSDRFKLLTGGRRNAMPRHQTLRATLEWSFSLLTDAEQKLLARLGLFAGPFTLLAAQAVALPDIEGEQTPIDLVSSLVSKSLISRDTSHASGRFYLFESMRAFALEKLAPSGQLPKFADRHAKFFTERLIAATSDWQHMPLDLWLAEYKEDLSDVRASLDWTLSELSDATASAQLLCDSLPFWMQLSLLDECRLRVETVLLKLRNVGNIDPKLEMRLQRALGAALAWVQGPTAGVLTAWERTLEIAEQQNDFEHRIQGHYGLWLYHLRGGSYELSFDHSNRLIELAQQTQDAAARLAGQRAKGVSLHFLGRNLEAREIIEGVLSEHDVEHSRSFPLRFGVDQRSAASAFLARVLWLLDEPDKAETAADTAIFLATKLNHVSSLCCALLEGQCALFAISESWHELKRAAETAIEIAGNYNLGFWRAYAEAFHALAVANLDPDENNLRLLNAASTYLERIHVHPGYSLFVSGAARACAQQHDPQGAASKIEQLIATIGSEQHWGMPEFLRIKAENNVTPGESGPLKARALHLAQAQSAKFWQSRIDRLP